jgi:hypothetical protein
MELSSRGSERVDMLLDEASVTGTAMLWLLFWQKEKQRCIMLLANLICNNCKMLNP